MYEKTKMGTVDFEFIPPPEAPVFEPNDEEFADPLAYIAKIRPIAEKAGICKIRPPPDWQPPFAVDVDNFKFTPRIQRLNELEAKTRIKLNFLDKIAKFWELQGSSLKIPLLERKALDLYTLQQVVQEEGGFEKVMKDRKWSRIAVKMGYPPGRPNIGSQLKVHYERILNPYQIFKSGASQNLKLPREECDGSKKDKDYVPHGIPSRQAIQPPEDRSARRSKRQCKPLGSLNESGSGENLLGDSPEQIDYSANNELRKLQFYGAGPKMPGYSTTESEEKSEAETIPDELPEKEPIVADEDDKYIDPVSGIERIMCHSCGRGDEEESMLLCDGCDDSYHTFCLIPPLSEIPKGDWRCPKCIAKEYHKPQEAFGFEQARKEYTLQSFGEMADQFKSDYFNMPVHMVPTATVEKEFWRIVSAINEDVTVEYGADLHTKDHGSGFPTKSSKLMCGDEEYVNSGWNLNVLPVLEGSVLSHINADISGMKIPWMYVGMCFATFCWHNEDHWSYSINYLHWGEPKTWYGVPGYKSEEFETSMKKAAPELFETQPDLLHQLVTIMNPNILMNAGVPIYRTNQCAGEFVVTFPRAYHAGFNQGYNFAEAVNFCPSDWLQYGRECIGHYSSHNRFCVFSHDELVCKMASEPEILDLHLAAAVYQDMLRMVESEMKLRKMLLNKGVEKAEREAFELLPDDERQCSVCKTTCFLSAITCDCTVEAVCVKHVDQLCECAASNHCLRYRYTLDEMGIMLSQLKARAESFDNWCAAVRNSLEAETDSRLELADMKVLVKEAEDNKYPESDLLKSVKLTVAEAEKCGSVAQQLVSKKVRTRNRQSSEGKFISRLTLEELQLFLKKIESLKCEIKEETLVKELIESISQFQESARQLLESSNADSKSLEKLLDVGMPFDIDLPEIPSLKQKLEQVTWLEEVNDVLADSNHVTVDILRKLLDSGVNLSPSNDIERSMAELQELLTQVERWEEKAKICLQTKPRHSMATMEMIINEAQNITAHLPNTLALKDAVKKAKEWNTKLEMLQSGDHCPYLELIDNLVHKGHNIPVRLEQLPHLESQISLAKSWRERTARTFLKKGSTLTLIEVLSPRMDIGVQANVKNRKRKSKDHLLDDKERENHVVIDASSETNPAAIVAAFKSVEQQELQAMRQWRFQNLQKRSEDNGDSRYCICRKALTRNVVQCELCKDWFHTSCVPLPKSPALKNKGVNAMSSHHFSRESKFLCSLCLRSRRPRLETIASLMMSLNKLSVRMPEGEALQSLTERTVGWQNRAREALATEELKAAIAKLSLFSQRMVEQAAKDKTMKIISSELNKAANNNSSEFQTHLIGSTGENNGFKCDETGETIESEDSTNQLVGGDVSSSLQDPAADGPQGFSSSEHAYSTASKSALGLSPRKHSRKSPLVPRQMESPILELSVQAKSHLDELMMEGDLLEVTVEETLHIWRILQACKPNREDNFPEFSDQESGVSKKAQDSLEDGENSATRSPIKVKKQRKMDKKFPKSANSDFEENSLIAEAKFSTKLFKEKQFKRKMLKEGKRKLLGKGFKSSLNSENCRKTFAVLPFQVKKQVRRRFKKEKPDQVGNMDGPGTLGGGGGGGGHDDPDDSCAAVKCIKPSGEVNWVQCDGGCELWFHLICVGLNTDDVNENEDYICVSCGSGKKCRRVQDKSAGKRGPGGKMKRKLVQRIPKQDKKIKVKSANVINSELCSGGSGAESSDPIKMESSMEELVMTEYDESEKVAIQSLSQLGAFPSPFDSQQLSTNVDSNSFTS